MHWFKSNLIPLIALVLSLGSGALTYVKSSASIDTNVEGRLSTVEVVLQDFRPLESEVKLLKRDYHYLAKDVENTKTVVQSQSDKLDAMQDNILEMKGDMKVTNQVLTDLTEAVKDLRAAVTKD